MATNPTQNEAKPQEAEPKRVTITDLTEEKNAETAPEKPGKAAKKPKAPKVPKEKKPKLTKEEKKQLRIQAAIAFKKAELRGTLKRELELSKKMYKKGRTEWEDICKDVKLTELREELQEFNRNTDRIFEQKDEKITSLLADLDSTEEMNRRNYGFQLQMIDYLIGVYKAIIETQKLMYESEAAELIENFKLEVADKEKFNEFHTTNCENIMHANNLIVEQELRSDYQLYLQQRDERVNKEIENRYNHRDSIVKKMQALQSQLVDFTESLKTDNLDVHKYERIKMLMDRQRIFVVESQKLNDQELQSNRLYTELQREMTRREIESKRKINDLRLEQAYFIQVRKNIEKEMNMDRDITFEKLKVLTTSSYMVNKELKESEKHGELLLSLAANCRKLQTESEKVVFGGKDMNNKEDSVEDQKLFKLKALDLKSHIDLSEKELIEQMNYMKNFWRRQAIVESENVLLEKEKRALMEENQEHIKFIKSMSKTDNADELLATLTVTVPSTKDKNELTCQNFVLKRK